MWRLKVLIVEDDEGARMLYCYMLASAGYKVNAVRSVLEAFAEIQVNRPDVIVTEVIDKPTDMARMCEVIEAAVSRPC